jgi:hypothetical protein
VFEQLPLIGIRGDLNSDPQSRTATWFVCVADTTVGLWMLGLRVNFFNDTRLCAAPCDENASADMHAHLDDDEVVSDMHEDKKGAVPRNPHEFVCSMVEVTNDNDA